MLVGGPHIDLPRQAASKAPTITPVILELGGGDGAEHAQGQVFFDAFLGLRLMLRFPLSARKTREREIPEL